MTDGPHTSIGQVKDFFSDIAFLLNLAWDEHKPLVLGLGTVRALGAVIPSIQVYVYLWKPFVHSRFTWDTPLSATYSPITPCTNH